MSGLNQAKAIALITQENTKNQLKSALHQLGKGLNALGDFSGLLNNSYKNEFKKVTEVLEDIDLPDVLKKIETGVQIAGQLHTVVAEGMVPHNVTGSNFLSGEGPIALNYGTVSAAASTIFNVLSPIFLNNSREIINRALTINNAADLIHEVVQNKWSKTEFNNFRVSKNTIEISEQGKVVRSDSNKSYNNSVLVNAKNTIIQTYPGKTGLGILPVPTEIPISIPNIADIPTSGWDLGPAIRAAEEIEKRDFPIRWQNTQILKASTGNKDPKTGKLIKFTCGQFMQKACPIPDALMTPEQLQEKATQVAKAVEEEIINPTKEHGNSMSFLSTGILELFATKLIQIVATKDITVGSKKNVINVARQVLGFAANLNIEAITKKDLKVSARGKIELGARKVRINKRSTVSAVVRKARVPKQIEEFDTKIPKDEFALDPLAKAPINTPKVEAKVNKVGTQATATSGGSIKLGESFAPYDVYNIAENESSTEPHEDNATVVDDTPISSTETVEENYS